MLGFPAGGILCEYRDVDHDSWSLCDFSSSDHGRGGEFGVTQRKSRLSEEIRASCRTRLTSDLATSS